MKSDVTRFYCKLDMLAELKAAGYSQLKLREQGLLWPTEITRLRSGDLPSWGLLEKVCNLTDKTLYDVIGDKVLSDRRQGNYNGNFRFDMLTDDDQLFLMSQLRADFEELTAIAESETADLRLREKAANNAERVLRVFSTICGSTLYGEKAGDNIE